MLEKRASALERLEHFDGAEANLSTRLEIKPLTPASTGSRRVLLRRKAYDEAIADFAAGRDLDPNETGSWSSRRRCSPRAVDHGAAVERYTAALAFDPATAASGWSAPMPRAVPASTPRRATTTAGRRPLRGGAPDEKPKTSEIAPVHMARGYGACSSGTARRDCDSIGSW